MSNCLVCQIVRREEPANLIYEDSDSSAFLHRFPLTIGHTIVAPKKHFADIFEADPESLSRLMLVVKVVSNRMKAALGIDAVNLINNSGEPAGQDVFHFHIHIIPRTRGDRLDLKEWWLSRAREAEKVELEKLESKLRYDASRK